MPGVASFWETVLYLVSSDWYSQFLLDYTNSGIRCVPLARCRAKLKGPRLGVAEAGQVEPRRGQSLLIPPHFLSVCRGHM